MPETVPGYYVWEAPGKTVSVVVNLDVVDRLLTEVMTGFGAIPRRGAEVGGILVGSIEGTAVRVENFEPVPCEYKRGPSYLLSEGDGRAFEETWRKWRPGSDNSHYAVGYYRSATRGQATVGDEDRAICGRYFPPPSNVMLLIKPHAMQVSSAGFITYENGSLENESALEFPFRRLEIEGNAAPARRPLGEHRVPGSSVPDVEPPQAPPVPSEGERAYAVTTQARETRRKGWAWIPLSFIFLLLGVLMGFQAALTIYPRGSGGHDDPFTLGLSVTNTGDSLHVKWDRAAQPIRSAQRGVLRIEDGSYTKQVDLDASQLQNGSVIYRHMSGSVQFRVEVYPKDRTSVAETVDWKQP